VYGLGDASQLRPARQHPPHLAICQPSTFSRPKHGQFL
jgi:hypothetical protein